MNYIKVKPKNIRPNSWYQFTKLQVLVYFKTFNKRELQRISINHSCDFDFTDFQTEAFRYNLLEKKNTVINEKLKIKNCNTILLRKQQNYHHYCQAKLTKYEYLTGEEILLSDQNQVIKQARFLEQHLKNRQKQLKSKEK